MTDGDGQLLARLRDHVLADPAAQDRLGRIERPDAFAAALEAVAAGAGIAAGAARIAGWMDAASGDRRRDAGQARPPPPGWVPAASVRGTDPPQFDWLYRGGGCAGPPAPADPFFGDRMARLGALPFNRLFRIRTTLEAVTGAMTADAATAGTAAMPAGLIFHMSRCGSTLLSNLLAAVPGLHVLSEPEPLDAVVRWAHRRGGQAAAARDAPAHIDALRAMAAALARDRPGPAARYLVKLDSWHALALPLFAAAFPGVPWLFLTRDPLEIAVSHLRRPGMQMVPGLPPSDMLGIAGAAAMPPAEHVARVLGRICGSVADHGPGTDGMLLDYADLPAAMRRDIPRHFGYDPAAPDRGRMAAAGSRHSKQPDAAFVADGAGKRRSADAGLRALIDRHARPAHDRLRAMRRSPGADRTGIGETAA